MRKIKFIENEYYHIFNRGVDKRSIFKDSKDQARFLKSMKEFNVIKPIGSIFENSFREQNIAKGKITLSTRKKKEPLIEFLAYCLNGNHYHFLLKQVAENGIPKFMHRLGLGYTKYFNEKHKRNGSLFQGTFKAVLIESNEQLLHVSAYVNLNWKVHKLGNLVSKSSWDDYFNKSQTRLSHPQMITDQFSDVLSYKKFAEEVVKEIVRRRENDELLPEYLET